MLDSETAQDLIKPHMPVVSSDNDELSTVDHVEGHDELAIREWSATPPKQ